MLCHKLHLSMASISVALMAALSLSTEAATLTTNVADGRNISIADLSDSRLSLSNEDRAALAQNQGIDVIIEFDQTDAVNTSAAERRQAGLQYDDAAILAERVQSYQRQKDKSLAALSSQQLVVTRDYSYLPMVFARVSSSAALQVLLKQPGVIAVHSNDKMKLSLAQSLPLIRQPETAAQGGTGTGTTVAVLDTGVDYTNAAFGSCTAPNVPAGTCKVIYAADFTTVDDGSRDDNGHGTNVAGIVVGVAPAARIAALDVFTTDANGTGASTSDILAAINWTIANKTAYNIVAMNLSLGGTLFTSPCSSSTFATPVANARASGILAAIASGNDAVKNAITTPGCVPAAVSVGAVYDSNLGSRSWGNPLLCTDSTTRADQITCFSNSASFLTLLAPGSEITAAGITESGTSQATPHVAGAIAVLRAAYPSESLDATVSRLTSTGVPITDTNSITKPRIDLFAAYTANNAGYALTASKAGTGSGTVTSSPSGIDCGSTCTANFAPGTSVTLSAAPASGSAFTAWSGDCTGTGTCLVTMNAAHNVTATFTANVYTLSVAKSGTGDGTVGGGGSYAAGAAVTLTETPAAGSTFTGWSPSPCAANFTMPANNLTCTANFTANVYTVSVAKAGTGSGTVGGGGNYATGATVTLTATPDSNSTFAGWSPSPCAASFTMPANNLTCTATFNATSAPKLSTWTLFKKLPPGNYLVPIIIITKASDDDGRKPTITATVASSEPQSGQGRGDKSPDWTTPYVDRNGIVYFLLRGESFDRDGRTYTVAVTATDTAGNRTTVDTKFTVPCSMGKQCK